MKLLPASWIAAGSSLAMALAVAPPADAQVYAAPDGTANASCTLAQPCTLEAARDRVRQILVSGPLTSDVVVSLRGGTYELAGTFRLEAQDSGLNGRNVVYGAYPNETPVLSGGRTVTGWTAEPGMPGVYAAGRQYAWSDRHLFVNGVRAVRARGVTNPPGFAKTATGYSAPDATVASWTGPIEVVSLVEWKTFRCGVASAVGTAITMKQPCWSNAQTHLPSLDIQVPTWFENARQLLDEEGEAYFESPPNTATTRVLYKPRAGEDLATATAVIPAVETLVLLDGTPGAPVHNVQFHGITFAYSHWGRPSTAEGYPAVQAGHYYVNGGWRGRPAAAVTARFAHEIRFERNTFTHLGGAGLAFERGVQDSIVSGNRFDDVSNNGIMVGEVGPDSISSDPALLVKDVAVRNNYVARAGAEYHDAVGIFAGHPVGLTVAHNELFDLPYTGISVGWTPDDPASTPTSDVHIEANLVSHHMQLLRDGGGIYTLEPQPNSRITRNYVHTQAGDFAGLYLDNLTAHYLVTENVVADVPYWYFIQPYYPAVSNTVTGNYSDEGGYPPHPAPDPSNAVYGNTVTGEAWPAAAQQVMAEAGLEPRYRDLRPANASLGRPASASSQWDAFWTPAKAVDGSAQWGWASSVSDTQSWWQVDLLAPHRIEDVELVARHRVDQPETRRSFDVFASAGGTFAPGTYVTLGGQGDAPFPRDDVWRPWRPTPGHFRHVRVARRAGFAAYNFVADLAVRTRRSVAEGKPAQASSQLAGYGPGAANNGLAADGWSQSYTDGASWWQVDLGEPHFISGVEIVGRPDYDQPGTRCNFEVRASNDPAFGSYVVVGAQGPTPFPHQAVWESATPPPAHPYRYVRVAKTIVEYFFLADVRVFGVPAPAPAPAGLGRPAAASSEWDANYSAAKANDGLTSTGWSPSGSDSSSWWSVDLGAPVRVHRIELVSRQDLDQPEARRNFQVELSNDPTFTTFVVAGTQGAASFPHAGTWSADPPFTTAYRYVRAQKTAGEYFFIAELRVLAVP